MRPCLPAAALAAFVSVAAAEPAADPAAPVPRTEYRSVLDPLPRGVEAGSIPWRDANAAVAEFPRGHIDLLKWEQRQGAAPTTPPAAVPAPEPHGGHHR
ncbi:MAG: hypothetical protein ACO1OY_06540 [Ramlibacter sp.]